MFFLFSPISQFVKFLLILVEPIVYFFFLNLTLSDAFLNVFHKYRNVSEPGLCIVFFGNSLVQFRTFHNVNV